MSMATRQRLNILKDFLDREKTVLTGRVRSMGTLFRFSRQDFEGQQLPFVLR